ncbi:MAG: polysaccharide pyruvyl transferase CsaB [bacterium]
MGGSGRAGILISGFYGFGNLGDEAVLTGMVRSLRSRLGDVPLIVLSGDPPATAAGQGVEAVDRIDAPSILRAMRRSRLFISGGGSLLQDATSGRSALYYLGLLWLAEALVPRTMIYASGIGPLRRGSIRALTAGALRRLDAVTVRDADSAALVRGLAPRVTLTLTADPAVVLEPAPPERADELLRRLGVHPGSQPLLGVAVRPWGDNAFVDPLGAALRAAASRLGARVILLPFHPVLDLPLSRDLAALCGGVVLEEPLTPAAALALIGRTEVLVGLRLHALLFAAVTGTPPVGLAYDPKVRALMGDLGVGEPLALDAPPEAVADAVVAAWSSRRLTAPSLAAVVAMLRGRAALAAAEAARLYAAG